MKDKYIVVRVKGEWYNNKPHGTCWIYYKDVDDKMWSFEGIGTFMNGVLNGGPLVIQFSNQWRCSYSYIK